MMIYPSSVRSQRDLGEIPAATYSILEVLVQLRKLISCRNKFLRSSAGPNYVLHLFLELAKF
jgi:hypothetical protein